MSNFIGNVTLHCTEWGSNKSYTVYLHTHKDQDGSDIYTVSSSYGPCTSPHRARGKSVDHRNMVKAHNEFDKIIQSKLKKGYEIVDFVGPVPKLGCSLVPVKKGKGPKHIPVYDQLIASLGGVSDW